MALTSGIPLLANGLCYAGLVTLFVSAWSYSPLGGSGSGPVSVTEMVQLAGKDKKLPGNYICIPSSELKKDKTNKPDSKVIAEQTVRKLICTGSYFCQQPC